MNVYYPDRRVKWSGLKGVHERQSSKILSLYFGSTNYTFHPQHKQTNSDTIQNNYSGAKVNVFIWEIKEGNGRAEG